jgi:hypothetical protein
MNPSRLFLSLLAAIAVLGAGCVAIPPDILKPAPESAAERELQTRTFRAAGEKDVLAACAAVLQDVGYSIEESEVKLGVIVASKEVSAANSLEVAGQVLFKVLSLGRSDFRYAKRQVVRASLAVRPGQPGEAAVRITFQRHIIDNNGVVIKAERLNEPALYEEFFTALSRSVFLQTQLP